VVLDVLAYARTDLRSRPYDRRRAILEVVLRGGGVPSGLVLTLMTTEHAVARAWLAAHGDAGIEGGREADPAVVPVGPSGMVEDPHAVDAVVAPERIGHRPR
jgi:hypothetical protein